MNVVKLKFSQLLYNAVHIGHPISQSSNFSTWYIYGVRYSSFLISPSKMVFFWKKACFALSRISLHFGSILFVNLESSLNYLMYRMTDITQQPMVLNKWKGGLLTNWKFVFLRKLPVFKKGGFVNSWSQDFIGNLKVSTRLPTAIFTFNILNNGLPFQEARVTGLPIFSLSDSNVSTNNILYPLPGNDDAVSSITFCSFTVSKSVLLGRLCAISKYTKFKKVYNIT